MLVDHMARGFSFESFAADIDACRETLYDWANAHPKFLHAKKKGRTRQLKFYENIGLAGAAGKIPGFNPTAFIWQTKNLLGWRDKHEITGADGGPIEYAMKVMKLDDEQLKLKAEEAMKYLNSQRKEDENVIDITD